MEPDQLLCHLTGESLREMRGGCDCDMTTADDKALGLPAVGMRLAL